MKCPGAFRSLRVGRDVDEEVEEEDSIARGVDDEI